MKKICVVTDWDSCFVLGRKMDAGLCLQALEMALKSGRRPRIFNTDQGSQYIPQKTGSEQSEQKAYKSAWMVRDDRQIASSWSAFGGHTSISSSCSVIPGAWKRLWR